MSGTPLTAGISLLDEAHGKRLAGDREGAMRICVAILDANGQDLHTASLLGELLVDAGRPLVAGELALRAVDGYVRRGDLVSAACAAIAAEHAGEDPGPLRATIAAAFGKGSARAADVTPAPPPLPSTAKVTPVLSKLSGERLLDRAEEALTSLMGSEDPVPADAQVPRLPLFGELQPKALGRLLEVLTVRDAQTDEEIVAQGAEGREAFVVGRGMVRAVRTNEGGEAITLAALGPGSIFGEMALVSDSPRAAAVIAIEPTRLLVAPRAELEKQAAGEPAIGRELGTFCRSRMVSNLMRHSRILGAVEPADRADLMARFETRTFEAGDALVRQGEEAEGLFLIASGHVHVEGTDEDGDALHIATLGPGDVVGEISLILRRPATADVVASHHTVALELSRDEFHLAIKDHPQLLNDLYELATRREEETRSVVALEALDVEDVVLL